jgi:hypothetical protein
MRETIVFSPQLFPLVIFYIRLAVTHAVRMASDYQRTAMRFRLTRPRSCKKLLISSIIYTCISRPSFPLSRGVRMMCRGELTKERNFLKATADSNE